jgi:hypothetical protein
MTANQKYARPEGGRAWTGADVAGVLAEPPVPRWMVDHYVAELDGAYEAGRVDARAEATRVGFWLGCICSLVVFALVLAVA